MWESVNRNTKSNADSDFKSLVELLLISRGRNNGRTHGNKSGERTCKDEIFLRQSSEEFESEIKVNEAMDSETQNLMFLKRRMATP